MRMADTRRQSEKAGSSAPACTRRLIDAHQLLQGEREVWIVHDGVRYRLRLTRRNRLVLQK